MLIVFWNNMYLICVSVWTAHMGLVLGLHPRLLEWADLVYPWPSATEIISHTDANSNQ
jgi:hypothetical protein